MPVCSLCNHELEGHICKDCAEAMARDIQELESKLEELERDMERAKYWIENFASERTRV